MIAAPDHRGLEALAVQGRGQPREVAAVAPSAHADAIAVDQAARDQLVDSGQHVVELATAEVLLIGLAERDPATRAAAIVGLEHHVAVGREQLRGIAGAGVPALQRDALGPAVRQHHQRIALALAVVDRQREHAGDVEAIARLPSHHALRAELLARQRRVRHAAAPQGAAGQHEHLGGMLRGVAGAHQRLAGVGDVEAVAHRTAIDHARALAARQRERDDRAAGVLVREHEQAVRGGEAQPLCGAAVVERERRGGATVGGHGEDHTRGRIVQIRGAEERDRGAVG